MPRRRPRGQIPDGGFDVQKGETVRNAASEIHASSAVVTRNLAATPA
jgi:hypothetical protein